MRELIDAFQVLPLLWPTGNADHASAITRTRWTGFCVLAAVMVRRRRHYRRLTFRSTLRIVPVLNFRTDERSEAALAELTADGSTTSEAIRQALVDSVKLRRREQMRAESRELANDEADLAESRRVLAEMDELRAG